MITSLNHQVDGLKNLLARLKRKVAKSMPDGKNSISKGAKGAPEGIDNPNFVVDVPYPAGDFLPLPVDFLRKDSNGKGIAEALYDTAEMQRKRVQFHKARDELLKANPTFTEVLLSKYNNALDETFQKEGVEANKRDWKRLNAKFGLEKVKTELPMCVMVTGYNNNANFRIEQNLNSIFSQNYTNYRVVVIDDFSDDASDDIYRKYFAFHMIDKERYVYIENSKQVKALQNIYLASMNHCPFDSIVVTLDADDEFIGRNILQVFNWGFQTLKTGVLYSNFIQSNKNSTFNYGFTTEYSEQEKHKSLYREVKMKFSSTRAFRNELIFQIDPASLQDDNGVFFAVIYDLALYFPLMELSCGRVRKIEGEYHLFYNFATGLNDILKDGGILTLTENTIRKNRKKYDCYKDFDHRMGNE